MNDINIVCNKEITDYFNCVERYKNSTSVQDTMCSAIINSYYKCLDNKRYTECLLKKEQREREQEQTKNLLIESSKTDYQEYRILSSL